MIDSEKALEVLWSMKDGKKSIFLSEGEHILKLIAISVQMDYLKKRISRQVSKFEN